MSVLLPTPSSQWRDEAGIGLAARRLAAVLDASGFWVVQDGSPPNGAFIDDPGGSGFTVIDNTLTLGLRPTVLPSGMIVIY